MRKILRNGLFVALILGAWTTCFAEEDERIRLSLVEEGGNETSVHTLSPSTDAVKDILFRPVVPRDIQYELWALEVSNPGLGQSYRLALDGKVPAVVHWDGVFSSGGTIRANQTYYLRLILITTDKRTVTSPLSIFTTKQGTGTEFVQLEREKVNFYLFPSGGAYYANIATKGPAATHFPVMELGMKLAFSSSHAIGLNVETTPSILTNVAVTPAGFFYSHITVYYRYRLWGDLPHPPILPANPEYAKGKTAPPPIPARAFGAKSNLEIGIRTYVNTLRGFGNQEIDSYLSRQSAGLAISLVGDRRLGVFRWSGELDLGYSVLKGSSFLAHTRLGISYDRLEYLTPGLEMRYMLVAGDGVDDPFDNVPAGGPKGVMNHLLMLGFSFKFKI